MIPGPRLAVREGAVAWVVHRAGKLALRLPSMTSQSDRRTRPSLQHQHTAPSKHPPRRLSRRP
jgi:hypothetical protein